MIAGLQLDMKPKLIVAGFMSGEGSTLRRILEYERKNDCSYHVAVIFSDNSHSNATIIANDYQLPVIVKDIRDFYKKRNAPLSDRNVREDFDREVVAALEPYSIDCIAYAGYMSIVSSILVNTFIGINIHPADLTITENGRPKYRGLHAVEKTMLAGENHTRSTIHLVTEEVDGGSILRQSDLMLIDRSLSAKANEALLKKVSPDMFAEVLNDIGRGRLAFKDNKVYFDGKELIQP